MADGEDRDLAHDESRRLRTLREYRILDTAPEPAFDRVTKLVADLFDAHDQRTFCIHRATGHRISRHFGHRLALTG